MKKSQEEERENETEEDSETEQRERVRQKRERVRQKRKQVQFRIQFWIMKMFELTRGLLFVMYEEEKFLGCVLSKGVVGSFLKS